MKDNLKCFISASYDIDLTLIKNILSEYNVETFDLYDFSIGDSIQQILKRKIRQADFALFVVSKDNLNVIYEMGVCEGLGKQQFIFVEKDFKVPFYIENKLFIRADLKDNDFLRTSISKIIQSFHKSGTSSKKEITKSINKEYSYDIKENLKSYLPQIKNLRESKGRGRELEYIIEEIFKTIRLNYVENSTGKDTGIDFALWSDELGKILGNPIIVEVKYGNLTTQRFRSAEEQIKMYISKSDAKVAFLLYLDNENKRHKISSSLNPLIISYDVEDFVNDLLTTSFENIVLGQRNKIAHGVE